MSSLGEVSLDFVVDDEKNRERLQKDLNDVIFEIERSEKMLSNPNFLAKAPEKLVAAEKEKLNKNKLLYESILEKLK